MNHGQWNNLIRQLPDPHILQTREWGKVKGEFGWKPIYRIWGSQENPDAVALVLERSILPGRLGRGFRVLYVPKGPLIRDWHDKGLVTNVLNELRGMAKARGAIFVKIDPDVPSGTGMPGMPGERREPLGEKTVQLLKLLGWMYSRDQIQFRNTVIIDLKPAEELILAAMKQKTRYNVRLAERKGVCVRQGTESDFSLLYQMYAETSLRDGFAIRDAKYYHTLWKIFLDKGADTEAVLDPVCEPLIAEMDGKAVAAVVIFRFAGKAYYMHGMSQPTHRSAMPNYLLQWEAIRRAKAAGCRVYDLWGAPEIFDESDSMWGVYRFKDGFGGTVQRTIGAYDYPVKPVMYRVYTELLPRALEFLRQRGKSEVAKRVHKKKNNE